MNVTNYFTNLTLINDSLNITEKALEYTESQIEFLKVRKFIFNFKGVFINKINIDYNYLTWNSFIRNSIYSKKQI